MATTYEPKYMDFEKAALPYANELLRTASRVIGDRTEAEDLVQETYLQAWKSFHRFELGTNCRAWLHKILTHVIQYHRRKKHSDVFVHESDDLLQDMLRYEPPVPQHITDEDMLSACRQVPDCYRQVIILADVEEYSYKEIAGILDIPIGTVMSRLNRGRNILKTELSDFARSMGVPVGHRNVAPERALAA